MEERGVNIDHATPETVGLLTILPLIVAEAKKRKCNVATSLPMDETYVAFFARRWV